MLFASLNQFYSSAGDLPVQWICVQRSNGHLPPASKVPTHRRVCGHRFPPLTTICWTLNPRTTLLQWRLVNCVHCENRREKASQLLGLDWSLQVSLQFILYVMFEGSISLFFRVSESNLEDHLAYTWASTRLVRDAVYEVFRTPNYGKACFEKLLQAARIYLCKK